MKKLLIFILLLLCVILISAYIFIPAKIEIREAIFIKANQTIANRFILDDTNWNRWWPKENKNYTTTDTIHAEMYAYKNYNYSVAIKMLAGDSIFIKNNSLQLNSLLNIIPISPDTIAVQWRGQSETTANPFKRFNNYLQAKKMVNNMDELLQSMKMFLEKEENLYGILIDQLKVKDTLLVATKYSFTNYPTTPEIYKLINSLKDYISKEGGQETNYPMLNVMHDSGLFKTMVAIPVNKPLATKNNFLFKRMVPGKILVTDVKGGDFKANQAIKLIEMYMNDYHLMCPAIPFQSLVTDRSKEPDTTKWVTKIFYPVM